LDGRDRGTPKAFNKEVSMKVKEIWSPDWAKRKVEIENDILTGDKETIIDVLTDEFVHCKVEALLSRQEIEGAEKVRVVSGMGTPVDEVYIKVLRECEE
jgi:hypothetical protein